MSPFKALVRKSHLCLSILFPVALPSLLSVCLHLGIGLKDYVTVWVERYTSHFRIQMVGGDMLSFFHVPSNVSQLLDSFQCYCK